MSTEAIESPTTEIAEYSATQAGLTELRGRLKDVAYDVTTGKGMAVAVKDRAEVRALRVGLEKMRVSIKAPALERCRLIDAEAKKLTADLEALEKPIDDQIKVEERRKAAEVEEKRAAEIKRRESNSAILTALRQRAFDMQGKTAHVISGAIVDLHVLQNTGCGVDRDYDALAVAAFAETREKLRDMHQAAIEREAEDAARKAEAEALAKERAELQRLRAEQDARDRTAREALANQHREADAIRAKADAEARALRDTEEARQRRERADAQAKIDAERTELRRQQDALDSERRKRADAEARERIANQKFAADEERRKQDEAAQAERARAQAELQRLEAAHVADAKGRAAWADLAHVCEMVMAGEKIALIRFAATTALEKAGRLKAQ